MTFDSDSYGEMHRLPFRDSPISDETADRLLSGRVPAADVPQPYRGLASLFETAAGAPTGAETAHKATVVAAAIAAIEEAALVHSHAPQTQTSRRSSMLSKLLTAKAAAVATVAALGLGTAAAAATGALPTQTSHANSHASAGLAIAASSSSGSNSGTNSNGHGKNSSGSSSTGAANNKHAQFGLCTAFMAHHPASTTPASSVPSDSSRTFSALISGHGGLAGTTTYCQGVIAQHNTTAGTDDTTNGAGDNGSANKPANAGPRSSTPPVSTPNTGGTGTADTASGGSSSSGTSTANTSSGGASSSGSGNAGGH